MPVVECERCGSEFKVSNWRIKRGVRFCSRECRKKRVTKVCKTCKREFEVQAHATDTAKYCSRECQHEGRRKKHPVLVCEYCGQDFQVSPHRVAEGARFCSRECFNNSVKPSRAKQKVCRFCGETFTGANKKYCSRKCWHETMKERITLNCEYCGVEFETTLTTGQAHCSKECAYAARRNMPKSERGGWVKCTCEICNRPFYRERYRVQQEPSRFCSVACANEWKRTITGEEHPLYKPPAVLVCDFCGQKYETKPALAERSRFCSRSCHGSWLVRNTQSPTSIEIAVEGMLVELGVPYKAQEPIGKYLCDFVVETDGKPLIIEADGIYWHSLPEVKRRDKRKNKWFKERGYQVLRLPGDKIRKQPEWCREQITIHLESCRSRA